MTLLVLLVLHADLNADGFAAYKKGDYAKADALFVKATVATPKNAWAWLNHARALAMLGNGIDPDEYCDYPNNWVLLALDALEHAVALDKAKVLAKWAEADPGTDALKKRPELALWLDAVRFDGRAAPFVVAHPDWHTAVPGDVLRPVTLGPRGWTVKDGKVQVAGKKAPYTLEVRQWYFDEGKKHFSQVVLTNTDETLELGPGFADCE